MIFDYIGMFKAGRPTQLAITYTCLTAFVLFDYDQGVFGGLLTNPDLLTIMGNPNSGKLGIIVACYNLAGAFGCLLNFWVGPKYGKKVVIALAMTLVTIGAVLQCTTYGVPQLVVGRVITGLGVGIDVATVPTYQSELSKRGNRGRLVMTEIVFVTVGVVVAYFFDVGMSYVDGPVAWRLPIACQCLLALIVLGLIGGLPETPRYLIQRGLISDAEAVLAKVWNVPTSDPAVQQEKDEIIRANDLERSNPFKWTAAWSKDAVRTRWRLFLAVFVLFTNQWTGANAIVFYAPTIMEQNVGLSHTSALIAGGCINMGNMMGAFFSCLISDRIGRKKPLLIGLIGQSIFMMLFGVMIKYSHVGPATGKAAIAFLLWYEICFGASSSSIPWLYSAEILPIRVRAQGTSLAVFTNWMWQFTIVMATPTMISNLGWETYMIFMSFGFAFVPMVYFWVVETKNLGLEEIDYLFLSERAPQGEHPADVSLGGIETGEIKEKVAYEESPVSKA
ncbi:uncharacterized protein PV07_03386 [Cladophialophora immunda]|uniref:Major facilitator superfamily (MFS) profile domain-containing protein n=1 Tax=Cladophialophora immunda TaxID=569365 RepID=A0A0D2D7S6_9EURO|nr:uncharacterized protein PV07_03386 [Cladophialophora immunda]KIW31794.1 hypothetical protein PV07_03386 [Cladophialophora immunda]